MKILISALIVIGMTSCTQTMQILDGATHARGTIHIEGASDTEADVDLCKVPDDYTPEQAAAYCNRE